MSIPNFAFGQILPTFAVGLGLEGEKTVCKANGGALPRQVLIDADGCPVVDLTLQIAKQFDVPVIILCDTSYQKERDTMAYLKLMMDEKEIAHLSEDGQHLCANEGIPQYHLPLNLFIGDKRKVPLVDVVVWAKKRIFPKNWTDCKEILKLMGLPDYNAWEIVKRTNACLMEDPYWLRFSEDETFEDTTRGRARRIMRGELDES